jgi:DNA-binding transcriptional ArsR family regulator
MSYKAYDWVWTHKFGSPTAKLVMMAVAKHADEKGMCWPRVRTLAEFCGISARTVQRQLKEFEQAGLITIQKKYRADGGQTANVYCIALPVVKGVGATDKAVTGGMSPTTPLPQTAERHRGHDIAVTYQELTRESQEELLQTTDDELRIPKQLKKGDRAWIVQLLGDIPRHDHQILLDELSEALRSGKITTTPQRWFYGLKKNYLKGSFCPLARPSKSKSITDPTLITHSNERRSTMSPETKQGHINALKLLTRNIVRPQ